MLHWAPATETIEQVVLGLGRDAAPFLSQLEASTDDGEVLLIEIDGECPPTATKRKVLAKTINSLEPRLKLMRFGCWLKQGLVIGSGQVEGAVRHLVGERFDCAGVRWVPGTAEALLGLRCIELNGDWEQFVA